MRTPTTDAETYRLRLESALVAIPAWLGQVLGLPVVDSVEAVGSVGGVQIIAYTLRGDPAGPRSSQDVALRLTVEAMAKAPAYLGEANPDANRIRLPATLTARSAFATAILSLGSCPPLEPLDARVVGDTVTTQIVYVGGASQSEPVLRIRFEISLSVRAIQPYPVE